MTTVGLEPTTVEQAGALMAPSLGLSWPGDRREIVEYLNDFRDILYNLYADMKLFDNAFHCICVSSFPKVCGYPCANNRCYQGFVLPADIMSVESAWEWGYPLKVRSRWREAHLGIDNEVAPRVAVTRMAQQSPTERAMRLVTGLKVFAEDPEDEGREVFIEAVMSNGSAKTLRFTLIGDAWARINHEVRQIISVSLPAGRHGSLILAQTDGYELSIYAPHETVPTYQMFRIAQQTNPGTVFIQGTKRFVPVAFDHDVVEVGSRTVLKAAGSFLKFKENTTDKSDLTRAMFDKTEMGQYLTGLYARHNGNAKQDPHPMSGRRVNTSKTLPGYAK